MTFEYRDDHQLTLRINRLEPDYPGQTVAPAIWIETSDGFFSRTAVKVPADRVEEVVAGIRDAARTAARQTTGQDDTDLPARLRATLTERFTELGNPFSEMRIQFKGPDGWPASKPVGPDAVAQVLRELLTAPEAGQPAEAHVGSVWTPANLHFLRFALGCAAAVMYSEDDFTDEDHAALDQLRAFAGPSPEEQAFETRAAADAVEGER